MCSICCDWTADPTICGKCRSAAEALGTALSPVVPISLYVKPSAMRDRLTYYKDPRDAQDDHFRTEIAALFARFFMEHEAELASRYGNWDVATVVPTKSRGAGPHPLEVALSRIPPAFLPAREILLILGLEAIDRRRPAPAGFAAEPSVAGRRVLVLDDVYTTGATAQSAVHALTSAGAVVPAVVVAGRRLNPDTFEPVAAIVERQRRAAFSFPKSPWDS